MKKIFFFLMIMFSLTTVSAQREVRLNAYGAYVFDESFGYAFDGNHFYDGTVDGGFQWGFGVEYMVNPTFGVELFYLRQDTKAPTRYNDGYLLGEDQTDFEVGISYIMLGGDYHFRRTGSKAEGYFGIFLGWMGGATDNPDNGNHNSVDKFAWATRLGANIFLSEKIGIKLQALLLSAVNGAGGGMYFGTGGVGVGLSTYSTFYQFSLGGGLTFRLGK